MDIDIVKDAESGAQYLALIGVIISGGLGLIPNFCCAPACGCGWIATGTGACYLAGLVFAAALGSLEPYYPREITKLCIEQYNLDVGDGNVTDEWTKNIYEEIDGECYEYNRQFTDWLRTIYWISFGFFSAALLTLVCGYGCGYSISKYESPEAANTKPSKPSELKPLVSQQQIELSEIKF